MPDIGAIPSGAGAGLWVITTTYTSSILLVELLCGSDRNFSGFGPARTSRFYRPQQQEAQERVALFARAKPLRRSDDQHKEARSGGRPRDGQIGGQDKQPLSSFPVDGRANSEGCVTWETVRHIHTSALKTWQHWSGRAEESERRIPEVLATRVSGL